MVNASVRKRTACLAGVVLLAACGDDDVESPPPPEPATFVVESGNDQHTVVGEPLDNPVVLALSESLSASVTVTVAQGGGSVRTGGLSAFGNGGTFTTRTDDMGRLVLEIEAGPVAGLQLFRASTTFVPIEDAELMIALTAAPGPVAQVSKIGDGQLGTAGELLALPIGVLVTDRFHNPIGDVPVSWVVSTGGGAVDPDTSITNTGGVASVAWTLGGPGAQTATATVDGSGTFLFTATGQ